MTNDKFGTCYLLVKPIAMWDQIFLLKSIDVYQDITSGVFTAAKAYGSSSDYPCVFCFLTVGNG